MSDSEADVVILGPGPVEGKFQIVVDDVETLTLTPHQWATLKRKIAAKDAQQSCSIMKGASPGFTPLAFRNMFGD